MKIGKSHSAFSSVMRLLSAMVLVFMSPTAFAQATLSTAFAPNSIAPGSSSKLTFTINNPTASPIRDLTFTNVLPAGMTIAVAPGAFTDCLGASLSAPAGGSTITLTGGGIPASRTCTVSVNVTGSTAGVLTNPAVTLTSDSGSSMSTPVDLTVVANRPVFTAAFSPATVAFGGRSTLTFTIDNSANAAAVATLNFSNTLPAGLVIASPANATTDCGSTNFPPTLTAVAGSNQITLFANGFGAPGFEALPANGICTVSVDVVPSTLGTLENVSGELLLPLGISSGLATAALVVNPPSEISVAKTFTNDPGLPNGTVNVEYTLVNRNRRSTATNISFTDDFDAVISGLVATGLPQTNICGAGSSLTGTSLLSFTGGSLGPGESCTFNVTLVIPVGATAGSFTSSTSTLAADLDGSPVTGDPATDTLFINTAPAITRTFSSSSVVAGGTVTAEYTITNTDSAAAATDITFVENLANVIPGITTTGLPASDICGTGSNLSFLSFNPPPPSDAMVTLTLSGGTLAAGESCTFQVDFVIPGDAPAGVLNFDTGPLTATIGGVTVTGVSASASLNVVGGLRIAKAFNDEGLLPGGIATLEYRISLAESSSLGATNIAFTDDLGSLIPGLAAAGLPLSDVCGTGSVVSGTDTVSFSGGSLSPGDTCIFSVPVQVPGDSTFGSFPSTTSDLTAEIDGLPITLPGASDNLDVASVSLTHRYLGSPYVPGETATIEYTLTNNDPVNPASGLVFFHNTSSLITGFLPTDLPKSDVCGTGSNLALASGQVIFTGGNLAAGASCTFTAEAPIPAGAAVATYSSSTTVLPSAVTFEVVNPLTIVKSFTNDPVLPGASATLEYTLTNLDTSSEATNVSFMDDLGAAFTGLVATDLPKSDVCGVGSSLSGSNVVSFSGGTLAPGASCTFSVTVGVPASTPLGTLITSTSTPITGTVEGFTVTGNTAEDTLEISALSFTKNFDGSSSAGGTPVLTYTIENLSSTNTTERLGFTDNLEDVLPGLVSTSAPQSDICGTGSQLIGTSQLEFSDGVLAPGESCTFSVTLQVPAGAVPGSFLSSSSSLRVGGIDQGLPAIATLDVNPAPEFAKSFALNPAVVGSVNTLTFTIDNSASTVDATAVDFTDNLPAGMVVATPSNASTTCTGGTLTATDGSGSISYTGGTVTAGATCTVTVDVTTTVAGDFINTSGDLTSSLGNSGVATAAVRVNPLPGFSKSFSPDEILVGEGSTLTFTIDNSGSTVDATGVDFTDNLPAGMIIATPSNASTTCTGGTLTAAAGSGIISYTGGTVAAGASCTVTVDVVANTEGALTNTSGDLISSLGNSGAATDTLTVNSLVDLIVSTTESVDPLVAGSGTLTYIVTVENDGPSDATGVQLSEVLSLPLGVSINSITPSAETSFADPAWIVGDLAASTSATLTIVLSADASAEVGPDVISSLATVTGVDQTITNTSDDSSEVFTSIARNVDIAVSATESIDPVVAGSGAGNLTYVISATNNGPSNATGVELTNLLTTPAGVTVDSIMPSAGTTFAGSTWTLGDLVSGAGGTLTIIFTVDASAVAGTDVISTSASVSAVGETLINTGDDSATVATSVESPVDIVVDVAESTNSVVAGSGPGNLTYTVTATNNGPAAATGVQLSNALTLPAGVTVDSVTPSAGGSFADPTWTVGNLAASGTATLTVVLTVDGSAAAGMDVISDTATLTAVDQLAINTGDDSDTESTSITQSVDLALTVGESADPFIVCPDQSGTSHTVTVTNNGPGNATGVVIDVTQVLPADVQLTGATPSGSTSVSGSTWTVGGLASGTSETLVLDFEIGASVAGALDAITTNASVSAVTENDSDSGNDAASESTSIVSSANISATTLLPNPPKIFGVFVHAVQVTNNNPLPVPAARLFVSGLPNDAIVLNAIDTAEFGDPSSPLPYRLINESLNAGETKIVIIKIIRTGNQSPFTPTYTPSVIKEPEVAVKVTTVSPYPFKTGKKKFTHPIAVTNIGSQAVSQYRLFVDNLPGNVTLVDESGTADYGMPPVELPYILINDGLAVGETKIVSVKFTRTNNNNHFIPVYRTRVLNGSGPFPITHSEPQALTLDNGFESVGTAMTSFPQNGNLLEWDVTKGHTYRVEISEDLKNWISDPVLLTAEHERLQWFDDGGVTLFAPEETAKRYYRLIDVTDSSGE